MKEKAEILTPENFQKRVNQLKRGTLTPLSFEVFFLLLFFFFLNGDVNLLYLIKSVRY